ncbi:diacylglycerol kinase [Corynebacterium sp. 13CS0277]|uniref:YegS/Rv2252/BmrU family lipid kinase n=1 Tax=Corynebacterium sp. 13CS0277 TaxID=2071994 RepID=UPI000D03127B|nr:YegS/Rv2252/BmrU family lipid kinase [Corynebacterium sp. 13CS0277]PRQ10313.1 diacylglycerol kinase [Corynebacterium sp. 13CS0277]
MSPMFSRLFSPEDPQPQPGPTLSPAAEFSRVALLTNPKAGAGVSGLVALEVQRHLNNAGIDVIALQGADEESARRLAQTAVNSGDVDALVVCGGDGLINLGLQCVVDTPVALGLVPAGTGNDHARAFVVPGNAAKAAALIISGRTLAMDVGKASFQDGSSRVFGTIAAVGFDSLVNARAARMKWPPGQAKYTVAAARELLSFRAHHARLAFDGVEHTMDVTLVATGNTAFYGGGMRMCPEASPIDGMFQVTVLEKMPRRHALKRFHTVFDGNVLAEDGVLSFEARRVDIDMPGVDAFADGEFFGPTPVCLEVQPKAARIITAATFDTAPGSH